MLRQSFILLDRVSSGSEQRLWAAGITDWETFRRLAEIPGFSRKRKGYADLRLAACERALAAGDHAMLAAMLPASGRWRLFSLLREDALYLDIETSGRYGDITVLGAWDGSTYYSFVRACNLEKDLVRELFARFRLFVTFNGASFDLPIIRRYFGDDIFPRGMIHVDLRHLLARLGLHGGLKAIEERLGIRRDDAIRGLRGDEACLLWHEYLLTGGEEAVETLLAYNRSDCENLEPLAKWAVEELWRRLRQ